MDKYIQLIAAIVGIGMMVVCTVEDISKKKIHKINIVVVGVAHFIWAYFNQNNLIFILTGTLIGGVLWVISKCTGEKIGEGDALLVLAIGTYLGFGATLIIVFTALILICFWGLIMIILKKKSGMSYEIAFVPFLMIPYIVAIIFQIYNNKFFI